MFGLRGRLIMLTCSFCLIPCLLITAFVFTMVKQNSVEMLKSELKSEVEVKTQWLESWCNELILIAEDSARNEVFQGNDEEEIIKYLRELRDFWDAETVALVDSSGSSRLNTYNYIARFTDPYIKDALNGNVSHGGVGVSTVTSNPIFSAAAPIKKGDVIIGALVINRNIQKIANNFNQAYGYESRDSFVLSPNRMVMTEGRLNSQIRMKVLDTPPARALADKESGSARYTNHQDEDVIGAWQISDMGWTIVEEVSASEAMAKVYQQLPLLYTLVGCMITLAFVVASLIANRVVKPIRRLALSANRIAEGNLALENKISLTSKDEIGHLANSFNAMVENLRYLISKVKQTANELGTKSNEIRSSSSVIADTTADQVTITQAVTQAVDSLARASEAITASALQARQSGENASQEARGSSVAIREAVESLNILKDEVMKLGVSSRRIGEIITVINDIADQTNLLALNAAIEAARAGEFGKSFSVVAEAIGSLAERAGSSTKEIGKLVGDTQQQIQNAVRIGESGAHKAIEAIEAMESIISQTENIAGSIGEITAAGEQQSAKTGEVTVSIKNLSTTSSEVATGAREMADYAKMLARHSQELQSLVANFINL